MPVLAQDKMDSQALGGSVIFIELLHDNNTILTVVNRKNEETAKTFVGIGSLSHA